MDKCVMCDLLHIAQELKTLMFMSTADRNRSGHAATDTINTFTAREGDGARVSFAGERMLHISFLYLRCVGADAW